VLGALVARWLPLWLFLPAVAALAAAAAILYSRERRLLPPARGWTLTALRALSFTLVLLVLVDLASVREDTHTEPTAALVVVDVSKSMGLESPSRIERVRRALSPEWFDAFSRRHRPVLLQLDGALRPLERSELESLSAAGGRTDLGQPLLDAALEFPRDTLAGIVLFSDGNHHGPSDARKAAEALALLGAPVVAVGVGSAKQPPDVVLAALEGPAKVFAGDEVEVEAAIENHGLSPPPLTLAVTEGEREVASFTAELPRTAGLSRWPLRFPSGPAGRKKFRISFPPQAGETSSANNERELWIEVLSEEASLLYVDGAPRWESIYLRSAWQRDEKVKAQVLLVTPPPERRLPAEFPRRREALFALDLIVLGDVEPALFSAGEQAWLAEFVRARGGTLVLIGGERAMPYAWKSTALEALLPVELLDPPPGDLGTRLARDGLSLTLTAAGEASDLFRLVAGRSRNVELWELLPPHSWFVPVAGVKEGGELMAGLSLPLAMRPGANEAPRERPGAVGGAALAPAFVVRRIGAGKVLYAGIDSTWRWRRHFGDEIHSRFWRQVVRWAVADRPSARDDNVRLGTDRVVYEASQGVAIEAQVERAPGEPIEDGLVTAVVKARAVPPAGAEPAGPRGDVETTARRVPLAHVPQSSGRWRGRLEGEALAKLLGSLAPPLAGPIECEVELEVGGIPGYSERAEKARAQFAVEPPRDEESLDLHLDRTFLEEIARLSGGSYLPLDEAGLAGDRLPAREFQRVERLEMALIDFPLALAVALLGCVALEWVLRKRWRLV
jgi:hypothetical protein